jgi:hypothetical protein
MVYGITTIGLMILCAIRLSNWQIQYLYDRTIEYRMRPKFIGLPETRYQSKKILVAQLC